MNKLIEEDRLLYKAILSNHSSQTFLQKVKEKILESDEIKTARRLRPDIDYYLEYTISGLFSLYLHWLNEPNHISVQELARIATELTRNGFHPLAELAKQYPTSISAPVFPQ